MMASHPEVELNIEGYPSDDFLALVEKIRPAQCSLVPDGPNQLTSDHGWNLFDNKEFKLVSQSCRQLNDRGIQTAIFIDPAVEQIQKVPETGASRIELYTETYATSFGSKNQESSLNSFYKAAIEAQKIGVGVNAGLDLDLNNLSQFLTIPAVLEVSIGHALIIESIQYGMENVVNQYLDLCK